MELISGARELNLDLKGGVAALRYPYLRSRQMQPSVWQTSRRGLDEFGVISNWRL